MANTRIENRVDARIDLARGQETARSGRGLPVAGDGQAATGFASMLATLGELGTQPAGTALQALQGFGQAAAAAAAAMGLERDAKAGVQGDVSGNVQGEILADALPAQPAQLADTALLAPTDAALPQVSDAMLAFATAAAAQMQAAQTVQTVQTPAADAAWPPSAGTDLTADAMLLAANGQMPWASLVGQTAQLDGKADRDLLQGKAGDWLSGHGTAAMTLLRQAQGVSAHAAFMSPQQTAATLPATAAAVLDATLAGQGAVAGQALATGADASASVAAQAAADTLAAMAGDGSDAATPGNAASRAAAPLPQAADAATAAARQDQALASGVALQGMTAVKPEEWRGFFARAREAGTAASDAAGTSLHGVAAALGAAQAGQQAGQQAPGQDASAFAQAQPDTGAGASEREQEISEKVAFWVHNKNQNASLTVDHEGRAIQVQVSLQGNEAHVRFGSSEAQAREMLGNGADQLRELLQAQGLQLAGVSVDVGGQSGGEGRQGTGEPARQGRVSARVEAAGVAEGRPVSAGAGRTAGGVDLFV